MKKDYSLILFTLLCFVVSGYGQIYTQSFEGALNSGYTSSGVFSDGVNDYFDLIGLGIDPSGQANFTNLDGTQYWSGEDTDDAGNPNSSGVVEVSMNNINISGFDTLEFTAAFGARAGNEFDSNDYIKVYADIGGGEILIGAFESENTGSNTRLALDSDLNGIGEGTNLNLTLTDFTFAISGTGTILNIRIEAYTQFGNTEFAFDYIRVSGNSTCAAPADPTGTISGTTPSCNNTTLTYTGTPAVGTINYWQTTATGTSTASNSTGTFNATTTGTYYVRAYDTTAMCWSAGNLSYAVVINSAPTISAQPTNQNAVIPAAAIFSVSSSNATSYQWQVSINGGGTWANVTGGTGATTDTYTTGVTSTPINNNLYRCVVTNACGSVNSNAAILTLTTIADVVITEIMYNSPTPGNDYEWIEICNFNGTPEDISNYTIDVNGTTQFTFPSSTSIPANSCITVLLGDDGSSSPECAFTPDYGLPAGTNILPNSPSAAGVDIEIIASDNVTVVDIVNYDDADGADGNGSSLHVTNAVFDNSNTGTNWQEVLTGGSPGDNTLVSPCTAPELQLVDASNTDQACGYTMNFGSQATGFNTDVTFDIDNDGSGDLTISSVGISGTNLGDFSIVSPATPFVVSALSTQTVTVRFTPTALGVRSASLTINNDDSDESTCSIDLQGTGISPTPDIDVERSTFSTIPSGSAAGNGFDTVFTMTPVNNSTGPKTYYIRNEGTADLNVTGINLVSGTNFTVSGLPSFPFTLSQGDAPVSFQVIFSPINPIGLKTDTVQIFNDDPDPSEATYTFDVQGEAICAASAITLFPSSGPAGTVVTVSGIGFDGSTTIDYDGVSLAVTLIDSNTIEVTIPSASVSGAIELTESSGCQSNSYFTIIDTVFGGCEGANPSSDLILYELYDENPGNGGMITIYNGTNTTRDLSDYKISRTTNYSNLVSSPYVENWYLPSGNLAPGELFRLKIGSSVCSDAFYTSPYDTIFATGFNANDGIQIRRTVDNSVIDEVLTPTFVGYYMKRNAGTLNPGNPYNASFWNTDTLTASECRVVGVAPTLTIPPPSVSVLNAPTFNCSTTLQLSITGGQGVAGGFGLTYQWYYLVPNTNSFVIVPATADFDNDTTSAALDIINPIPYLDYQFYCQVRENTDTCYIASNAVMLEADVAIWSSSAWSATPSSSTIVIIDDDYNAGNGIVPNNETSFEACQLIVNSGSTLNIANNTFVRVQHNVTVNGNIIVKTDGSFVQVDDLAIVNGDVLTTRSKISVEKETAPLATYQEYTYWSSPVSGETIGAGLLESSTNRRFWFNSQNFRDSTQESLNDDATNPGQDDIDDNGNDWQQITNAATVMAPGIGYAATHNSVGFTPDQYIYIFEGPFNNGVINVPIYRNDIELSDNNWNFIGNPYPSAIDADLFLGANGSIDQTVGATNGAIFFWSHNTAADGSTNGNENLNYSQSDYAIINGTGETAGGDGVVPDRFIPSGQGFFVSMTNTAPSSVVSGTIRTTDVVFNNSMRVTANNDQFFRLDNSLSPNKIRLNLTSDNGVFNQILVGYVSGATDVDDGMYFDAHKNLSANANSIIYSLMASSEHQKFAIQGKGPNSLTLDEVIPLGFYTSIDEATLYTLSIAQLEGEFMNDNTIYVKDNVMNVTHDLSSSYYTFTSETGEFNDRFEIVFRSEALSITENEISPNDLSIVELGDGSVKFSVGKSLIIKHVDIIDTLGRTVYKLNTNNNTEVYDLSRLSQAAYIARVTLSNGQIITKKAVKTQ